MKYFFAENGNSWYLLPENLRDLWENIGNHKHKNDCVNGRLIESHRIENVSDVIFENPIINE